MIPAGKNKLILNPKAGEAVTIKAPASLPADENQKFAIVHVAGATGVTISGFTISGPANGIGYGVLVDQNGSATVTGNNITAIHDAPDVTGNQNGVGIAAGCCLPTPGASSGSVTATNNTIDTYQKAGIDIRGDGSSGTLSGNNIRGAGPTAAIGQNGIQISRGAKATVTGNTVADNEFQPQTVTGTGILVIERTTAPPVGNVTISNNTLRRNDGNIFVFGVKSGSVITVTGNTTTAGLYGIIVDDSTKVLVEKNVIGAPGIDGIDAGPDAAGNTFRANKANGAIEPGHDCLDESKGGLTAGTEQHLDGQRRRPPEPGRHLLGARRGPAAGDRAPAEGKRAARSRRPARPEGR